MNKKTTTTEQAPSGALSLVPASPEIRPLHYSHYIDTTKQQIEDRMAVARYYINSGLIPRALDKPEKVLVIMALAQALDVPIMHALNSMYVVNGKPAMQADIMRALIFRSYPNATFEIKENTNKKCTILAGRPVSKPQEFSFTIEEAHQAGLTGKDVWKNYAKAMLLARATTIAARVLFADVLMGVIYTPEELGAPVNEDGEVIEGSIVHEEERKPAVKEDHYVEPEPVEAPANIGGPEYNPPKNDPYSQSQHNLMCKLSRSHLMPDSAISKMKAAIEGKEMTKDKAKKVLDYMTKTLESMQAIESVVKDQITDDPLKLRVIMLEMKNWGTTRLNPIFKSGKFSDKDIDDIGKAIDSHSEQEA
jgi:hypothetical protein